MEENDKVKVNVFHGGRYVCYLPECYLQVIAAARNINEESGHQRSLSNVLYFMRKIEIPITKIFNKENNHCACQCDRCESRSFGIGEWSPLRFAVGRDKDTEGEEVCVRKVESLCTVTETECDDSSNKP
ncbi:hypothetical protein EVAR_75492_1 [Eumeta japonica]|uniref:Uncharacterized protein n=1 Tax=Eumeta variegata TaxID=151549 RepID=A0A4C1TN38_EUMVA|nr:hypothetical protein EVAR_75492_1 [Eumeta japonica]